MIIAKKYSLKMVAQNNKNTRSLPERVYKENRIQQTISAKLININLFS
jgi:hypothetical protein